MLSAPLLPFTALRGSNRALLEQGVRLLHSLTGETYRGSHPSVAPQRVGPQLRHILEFYQCFLDGIGCGRIDYDRRPRAREIEDDRMVAIRRAEELIRRLETQEFDESACVEVRSEGSLQQSSAGRELQVLASHTTHHYALIALLLQARGIEVEPGFGVAPSTLVYRARTEPCAR